MKRTISSIFAMLELYPVALILLDIQMEQVFGFLTRASDGT